MNCSPSQDREIFLSCVRNGHIIKSQKLSRRPGWAKARSKTALESLLDLQLRKSFSLLRSRPQSSPLRNLLCSLSFLLPPPPPPPTFVSFSFSPLALFSLSLLPFLAGPFSPSLISHPLLSYLLPSPLFLYSPPFSNNSLLNTYHISTGGNQTWHHFCVANGFLLALFLSFLKFFQQKMTAKIDDCSHF